VSGVVAYEAARQLRAAGERVELVVLMESRVHPPDTVNRMIDRVATSVAGVFRLSPRQRLRLVIGARPKVRKLHAAYQMGARKLASTILRRVSSWRATGAPPIKGPALTRPEITGADAVRRAVAESNSLAAHGFFVREYSGRVCCLWAQDEPFWPEIWQSVAPQVELHPVPGNHNTCITTQITSLGTRIREALHRAQEEAAAASPDAVSSPFDAPVAAGPTASGPTPIAAAKSRFVSTTASL
jgi:thioesterase domain-containing protein